MGLAGSLPQISMPKFYEKHKYFANHRAKAPFYKKSSIKSVNFPLRTKQNGCGGAVIFVSYEWLDEKCSVFHSSG